MGCDMDDKTWQNESWRKALPHQAIKDVLTEIKRAFGDGTTRKDALVALAVYLNGLKYNCDKLPTEQVDCSKE